jgi:gamma-glutamyltranspeptidase
MRAGADNAAVKTTLENLAALSAAGQEEFLRGEVAQALATQVKEAFAIWKAEIEEDQQQQQHYFRQGKK